MLYSNVLFFHYFGVNNEYTKVNYCKILMIGDSTLLRTII